MSRIMIVLCLALSMAVSVGCGKIEQKQASLTCNEECDERWGDEADALGDAAQNYWACIRECSPPAPPKWMETPEKCLSRLPESKRALCAGPDTCWCVRHELGKVEEGDF